MNLTTCQYYGLSQLLKWYNKLYKQFIEVSGSMGTGVWDLFRMFVDHSNIDPREIMYLGHNQKRVLDLAYDGHHAYYFDRILYNYERVVDFKTISLLNPFTTKMESTWKRKSRSKINPRYKLIVVLDSSLATLEDLKVLKSFGRPVVLLRDPMLSPSIESHTFFNKPDINLNEISDEYSGDPIVQLANRVISGQRLAYGNFDNLSIIPRKQMNLVNLKSADMNITISNETRNGVNRIYREKILKRKNITNLIGERVIIARDVHNQIITTPDNKKIKIYLTKGTVGTLTKLNRHAINTKYVPTEFTPDFYNGPFEDMSIDRHFLNGIDLPCTQIIPDEILEAKYAYAITVQEARISSWDKVTMLLDGGLECEEYIRRRILYTGITRADKSLTLVI